MTSRVIVVGSVNVDLVASADRLPTPGETVTGASFARHHGGKGGNQAVAAARLGVSSAFVGAVGDDAFGDEARAALAAEGIDLETLTTLPGPTGVALILVDRRGENLISVASGANAGLTPDAVRAAFGLLAPGAGDVVLVGHEIPTATTRTALALARDAGATTILNPAPADGLDRTVFGLADILTPNRSELAALVADDARRVGRAGSIGKRPETAAASLLESNSEGDRRAAGGRRDARRRGCGHRRPQRDSARPPGAIRRVDRRGWCRRHVQRCPGRRSGLRPGARSCGPASDRGCRPVHDAGRRPRGDADACGARRPVLHWRARQALNVPVG